MITAMTPKRRRKSLLAFFLVAMGVTNSSFAADHLLGQESGFSDVAVSPDSKYVVTNAGRPADNSVDVISVPIAGGAIEVLSGPLVANRNALFTGFNSDGAYVLFRANAPGIDLFTVPTAGGDSIPLDQSDPGDTAVLYGVDPATDRALFSQAHGLVSAPATGGASPTLISDDLISIYVDQSLFIAPGGSRVAFQATETPGGVYSVYSSSVENGGVKNLLSQMTPNGWLDIRGFLPDGSAALLDAQWDNQFNHRLVTVPLDGGEPAFVSNEIQRGNGSPFRHFAFTGDSSSVLYVADTRRNNTLAADVFVAHATGGAPVNLTVDLDAGLTVSIDKFDKLLFSDAANRAVFRCREFTSSDVQQLYSVELDGASLLPLTPNTLNGEAFSVNVRTFRLAPGGNYVVFQGRNGSDQFGLYTVPVRGGEVRKLSEGEPVDSFLFSPDGSLVYYAAGNDVFRKPVVGGEAIKMNDAAHSDSVGNITVLSPDGKRLIYSTFEGDDSKRDLWSVDPLPSVSGDTNFDGQVDVSDLNNVRNNYGSTDAYSSGDTAPFDGIVDLSDLNRVRNYFGAHAEWTIVPEPSAISLSWVGGATWVFTVLVRRRALQ